LRHSNVALRPEVAAGPEVTMLTTLDEIADGIYRISTFVPGIGPDGFTFNQFLLDAEEPLLYHTGMKALFPLVSREVARVRPLEQLRWIAGSSTLGGHSRGSR